MRKTWIWLSDVKGTTAIEYTLIASGIALAIAATVFVVGTDLAKLFQSVGTVTSNFTPG